MVSDIDEQGNDISYPVTVKTVRFVGEDGKTYIKSYEEGRYEQDDEDAVLYRPERLRGKLTLYVDDEGYVYGYSGPGGSVPTDISRNAKGEYWSRGNRCQAIMKTSSTMKIVNIILLILSVIAVIWTGYAFGISFGSLMSLVCCILFVVTSFRGRRALENHYAKQTGEVGW